MTTDAVTIAPRTDNLTKRAVGHGVYHFFVGMFYSQSKWIHIVVLTARQMLTGHRTEASEI
jgi:hypothetical protein